MTVRRRRGKGRGQSESVEEGELLESALGGSQRRNARRHERPSPLRDRAARRPDRRLRAAWSYACLNGLRMGAERPSPDSSDLASPEVAPIDLREADVLDGKAT